MFLFVLFLLQSWYTKNTGVIFFFFFRIFLIQLLEEILCIESYSNLYTFFFFFSEDLINYIGIGVDCPYSSGHNRDYSAL